MTTKSSHLLSVQTLVTGYGRKEVLHGVDLSVDRGESVAIIGHNGAGKSTLLKGIFGLIPVWNGEIWFQGRRVVRPTPQTWLAKGMALLPQGCTTFATLSVRENLRLAASITNKGPSRAWFESVPRLGPALEPILDRIAGQLSGGEQQMLALAMSLTTRPSIVLLDEPCMGLAPRIAAQVFDDIQVLSREHGTAVLIVEQKVRQVLRVVDRVCVLRNGEVSFYGQSSDLEDDEVLRKVYL